jgi:hypothetical protein
VVNINEQQIYYEGGCFNGNGLAYEELKKSDKQQYDDTIIYIRHTKDPYI